MLQITTKLALVLVGSTLVQYALCTTSTISTSTGTAATTGNTAPSTTTAPTTTPTQTTLSPTTTAAGPTAASTSSPTTAAAGGASTSTNAPASSTVSSSGSTTVASGATGSTLSSSSVSSTASTTPAPAECLNQNCTGNLTCLDTNGATCLLGTGQCYQVVISNSTYSIVYTGCSTTCEAVSITAGEDYEEDKRCCTTNKCNGDTIPLGGNSATSIRITEYILVCLLLFTKVIR